MVVTEISNPFYPNLIAPLHDELAELGYRMALFTERLEGEQASAVDHLEGLFDRGIDGAVLTTSTLDGEVPRELLRRGLPFTFLTRVVDGVPADSVTVDNALGASIMAAEVARFGHRRVGAIFGPAEHQHGPRPRARVPRRAARRRRRRSTTRGPPRALHRRVRPRRDGAIIALDDRPTVVVCFNDLVAIGALNAARATRPARPGGHLDHGLGRPPDGLVGDLPAHDRAPVDARDGAHRRAADRGARRGPLDAEPRSVLFEPELVLRATLGPPPP